MYRSHRSDLHWRHPHRLRPESTEILIVAKATPEKDASFMKSRSVLNFRNDGSKREIADRTGDRGSNERSAAKEKRRRREKEERRQRWW
ncbi:hypothetical protein U1Q18_015095 [Sarracenia purpurea var. burkii]